MLDGKNIRAITTHGIAYLDEHSEKKSIYFVECFERYVKRHKSWEDYTVQHPHDSWNQYIEWVRSYPYVADRDITQLTIAFYTDPPVTFQFETELHFRAIQMSIFFFGEWQTFDLS